MRSSFIIFFTIFFTIYTLANLYIFVRGWQAIPQGSPLRSIYILAFLIISLSFLGARFLENVWMSTVTDTLVWVGSFWFAAMLYFLLALFILDLIRLMNHFFPFYPSLIVANYSIVKQITAIGVVCLNILILSAGHINAVTPRIKTLHLTIPKAANGTEVLNIVLASDIHLGTIVGRARFDKIVSQINNLNPDLILLPGDIVDEDLAPVIKQNLGESLRNLKARFGVYAITGNHEYIGGVEEACKYLTDHGVRVLRDQTVKINNSFYLVGREDRSISRFNGKKRKPLQDLMAQVDKNSAVILLDHQPFHLEEGETNGADLQISGHTHNGQLWPLNYITKQVYELSWGYKKKNHTHVYVSCGLGTWGPPVRLGNRPEIVNIQLNFVTQ